MKKAAENRRLEHSTAKGGILSSKNNEWFQVSHPLGNIVHHKDRVYQTNLAAESFVYFDTLPEKSIDNLRSIF